jgi:hypothetical protein
VQTTLVDVEWAAGQEKLRQQHQLQTTARYGLGFFVIKRLPQVFKHGITGT